MNTTRFGRLPATLTALAVAAALVPMIASAQQSNTDTSRTAVKEETKAANKSGKLMPAGELANSDSQKMQGSTKTRAERKAETMEARKKGELKNAGVALHDQSLSTQQRSAMKSSTKTRAERKSETAEAAKDKKLMPAGEVTDPAKK